MSNSWWNSTGSVCIEKNVISHIVGDEQETKNNEQHLVFSATREPCPVINGGAWRISRLLVAPILKVYFYLMDAGTKRHLGDMELVSLMNKTRLQWTNQSTYSNICCPLQTGAATPSF